MMAVPAWRRIPLRFPFGAALVFLSLAALLAGCGTAQNEHPVARLAGEVTIGGASIPADAEATIQFFPVGPGQEATAPIVAGKYDAQRVPKGKVLVVFQINRKTGKMVVEANAPGGAPYEERENLVPEKHRLGIPHEVTGDNPACHFSL